jgi:hypothetical protein
LDNLAAAAVITLPGTTKETTSTRKTVTIVQPAPAGDERVRSKRATSQGTPSGAQTTGQVASQPGSTVPMHKVDVPAEVRPWYWNLPDRARQVIRQSMAEPFPPGYELTVKGYYTRLSEHAEESER